MTKINPILIAALAFMAAMSSSCSKEECNALFQNNTNEERGTISVSVSGMIGEFANGEGAKAGMVNSVRVKWAAGDKVYAYDAENSLGELEVSLKDGKDYYAVLSGEITEPAGDKIFLVYGNALTDAPAISGGKIAFDLSAQASASGDYTESPFVTYGTMEYSGKKEISGKTVEFIFASSIMRLNCTGLEPNVAVTGAKLTGISNECVIDLSGDEAAVTDGQTGDISLSFTSLKASANGAAVFYASIAKTGTENNQVLEVTNGDDTFDWGFGKRTRDEGTSINAICQMKKHLPFTVGINDDGTRRTVRFAPGNLYCTRTGSEGNWSYSFAFEANQWDFRCYHGFDNDLAVINGQGTTTPENTSGLFQWVSQSCTGEGAAEARKNFGAFSVLDATQIATGTSTDDTVDFGKALVEGSSWRTLTSAEWTYIAWNTECEYATVNSVKGFILFPDKYVGPTEHLDYIPEGCVFLPCACLRNEGKVNTFGGNYIGCYWSSSAAGESDSGLMNFDPSSFSWVYADPREYGLSVRLVSEL